MFVSYSEMHNRGPSHEPYLAYFLPQLLRCLMKGIRSARFGLDQRFPPEPNTSGCAAKCRRRACWAMHDAEQPRALAAVPVVAAPKRSAPQLG